jgi:hypothetical protein
LSRANSPLVDGLVARRQHDHRQHFATRAQPPAGGQAVLTGQHQVEYHQLRLETLEKRIKLARIGQQQRVETVSAEIRGEQLAQFGIVVNQQDLFHRRGLYYQSRASDSRISPPPRGGGVGGEGNGHDFHDWGCLEKS